MLFVTVRVIALDRATGFASIFLSDQDQTVPEVTVASAPVFQR